jgi:hypothetical protein
VLDDAEDAFTDVPVVGAIQHLDRLLVKEAQVARSRAADRHEVLLKRSREIQIATCVLTHRPCAPVERQDEGVLAVGVRVEVLDAEVEVVAVLVVRDVADLDLLLRPMWSFVPMQPVAPAPATATTARERANRLTGASPRRTQS